MLNENEYKTIEFSKDELLDLKLILEKEARETREAKTEAQK